MQYTTSPRMQALSSVIMAVTCVVSCSASQEASAGMLAAEHFQAAGHIAGVVWLVMLAHLTAFLCLLTGGLRSVAETANNW